MTCRNTVFTSPCSQHRAVVNTGCFLFVMAAKGDDEESTMAVETDSSGTASKDAEPIARVKLAYQTILTELADVKAAHAHNLTITEQNTVKAHAAIKATKEAGDQQIKKLREQLEQSRQLTQRWITAHGALQEEYNKALEHLKVYQTLNDQIEGLPGVLASMTSEDGTE